VGEQGLQLGAKQSEGFCKKKKNICSKLDLKIHVVKTCFEKSFHQNVYVFRNRFFLKVTFKHQNSVTLRSEADCLSSVLIRFHYFAKGVSKIHFQMKLEM